MCFFYQLGHDFCNDLSIFLYWLNNIFMILNNYAIPLFKYGRVGK